MYENHIKEQVLKMHEYVSEMHSNHIGEIAIFKREKNEQLLVNQMLVQKVQSMDFVKRQQSASLETLNALVSSP